MSSFTIRTATVLVLATSVSAQVPRGAAIMSGFSNMAPMEGLLLVTGVATPITGLARTARASNAVNAIQLDPVDDRVWIGGIAPVDGRIDTLTIEGNVVASFAAVGNTGNGMSVSGIAFDANGNAVCTSGLLSTTGTGGLFRVSRQTNAVTRIVGGATWTGGAGTANCICSNPAGNLYFGQTTTGAVYMLAPGPDGDYLGPPVLIGSVVPPSSDAIISGLEYAPAVGLRPAILWWTSFGAAGTAIGTMALPGGQAVAVGPSPEAPNWIDYDAIQDNFWTITAGIDPDVVNSMTHAGVETLIVQVPPGGNNGSSSAIDVNDCAIGATTVIPQYAPVGGGIVQVEVGTCCPRGSIGGVAIISPTTFTLVALPAGTDGRVYRRLPGVVLRPGSPNTITLISACFDLATGALTLGTPVTWPRN